VNAFCELNEELLVIKQQVLVISSRKYLSSLDIIFQVASDNEAFASGTISCELVSMLCT